MQARFRLMARGEPSLKRQRVEEADDDRDRACTPPNPPPPKRVVAVARARLTTPRPNFASQARMNAPVPLYRRMQSPEVAKVGNGNVPQRGRTNERSYALPHQQQDQYSYSKNRFSPPRRNYSQSLARSFSPRPQGLFTLQQSTPRLCIFSSQSPIQPSPKLASPQSSIQPPTPELNFYRHQCAGAK